MKTAEFVHKKIHELKNETNEFANMLSFQNYRQDRVAYAQVVESSNAETKLSIRFDNNSSIREEDFDNFINWLNILRKDHVIGYVEGKKNE